MPATLLAMVYSLGLIPHTPSVRAGRSAIVGARRAPAPAVDRRYVSGLATAVVLGCALLPQAASAEPAAPYPRLAIETTAGTMEFELWPDVAPKTVENFVKLANKQFFDGQCFHRVISGFVIQV